MEAFRRIHACIKGELIIQIRRYVPRQLKNKEWNWNADEIVCKKLDKKDLILYAQMKEKYPEAFSNKPHGLHNQRLSIIELRKLKLEKLLS